MKMRIISLIFCVLIGEFIRNSIEIAIKPAIKTQLALATVNDATAVEPAVQRWFDYTMGWMTFGFYAAYLAVLFWAIWPIVDKPNKRKTK